MIWERFDTLKRPCLARGTLFRFPAKYPFEEVVDFMLFDTPASPSGCGLMADSGYSAGSIEILLPAGAQHVSLETGRKVGAIDTRWLQRNWRQWVYDVSPRSVRVCVSGRPRPRMPG